MLGRNKVLESLEIIIERFFKMCFDFKNQNLKCMSKKKVNEISLFVPHVITIITKYITY